MLYIFLCLIKISHRFDIVFALGDRFEMFSAVSSSVPFNIKIAHIHGGETTLGAIDDAFRHSITSMSAVHFTVAEYYRKRVVELLGKSENVYNVGSLSIDNLKNLKLLSPEEFKEKFNIDLSIPSVLITFHPETVSFEKNETHTDELIKALEQMNNYQLIITMPNADTMGNMIRKKLNIFIKANQNAIGIESFGTLGYLTAMKNCEFMLGNTSSGFVEAAFFPKFVVNLGNRQKGRILTSNIYTCEIKAEKILDAVGYFQKNQKLEPVTIYGIGNTADKIISVLKKLK